MIELWFVSTQGTISCGAYILQIKCKVLLTLGCLRDIISKLTRDEDTDTGTSRKLSDGWWS